MTEISALLDELKKREIEVNERYSEIKEELLPNFFQKEEWTLSEKSSNELIFKDIIFYLYKLYYERGKINIEVVAGFSQLCKIEEENVLDVRKNIHAFRTFFGHYLDEKSSNTKRIKQICEIWYISILSESKNSPLTESDWQKCVKKILFEAIESLEKILMILDKIIVVNDKSIYEQWSVKQKKDIPKYKKIEIIEEIKVTYNLNYDSSMLFQKYQKVFESSIKVIEFNDLDTIESSIKLKYETIILNLDVFPCPLTGNDVKKHFDSVDGKQLGNIMKRINKYHRKNRETTKEELLMVIDKNFNEFIN